MNYGIRTAMKPSTSTAAGNPELDPARGAVPAALPADETERLAELREADIVDTEAEEIFDRVVQLASQIAGTPIALVSLVDEDRQWFKAAVGLDATQTPRDEAFCSHAILDPGSIFEVEDATLDPRFATNPLVLGEPFVRFYAGVPLVTGSGRALGTLCVIDHVPRHLDDGQKSALESLALLVAGQLDLRILGTRHTRARGGLAQAESEVSTLSQFFTIFQSAAVGIVMLDGDGTILQANPTYAQLVGIAPGDIQGHNVLEFTHVDEVDLTVAALEEMDSGRMQHWRFEKRYVRVDGQVIWVSVSSSSVVDETTGSSVVISLIHDITDQVAQRDALAHSATHDPLTGVANRALLESRLQAVDRRLGHPNHFVALLYLDVDGFKGVNDTYGHSLGDRLLQDIAFRIQGAVRPEDLVARLGGDEFVVLCEVGSPDEAVLVGRRLQDAMAMPFVLDGNKLAISCSVGVAVDAMGEAASMELLVRADRAMYQAKHVRRGDVVLDWQDDQGTLTESG